jgi:plasmid stabilization system protein ParE
MAHKVIWTDPAIEDLEEIALTIASDNPNAARALGTKLFESTKRLGHFPRTGSSWGWTEAGVEICEIPCRGYRIFYQILVECGRVEILHLRHGARSEPKF